MTTLRANAAIAEAAAARGVEVPAHETGEVPNKNVANKKHRFVDTDFAILHTAEQISPAFCLPRAPLAIGIFGDVRQLLDGEYDLQQIKHFLHWYCSTHHYLEAVAAGVTRLMLDGTPPDPPTEEHREGARLRLAARK